MGDDKYSSESNYGYTPNEGVCIAFVVLFSVSASTFFFFFFSLSIAPGRATPADTQSFTLSKLSGLNCGLSIPHWSSAPLSRCWDGRADCGPARMCSSSPLS